MCYFLRTPFNPLFRIFAFFVLAFFHSLIVVAVVICRDRKTLEVVRVLYVVLCNMIQVLRLQTHTLSRKSGSKAKAEIEIYGCFHIPAEPMQISEHIQGLVHLRLVSLTCDVIGDYDHA
jgi:hypothetical protein